MYNWQLISLAAPHKPQPLAARPSRFGLCRRSLAITPLCFPTITSNVNVSAAQWHQDERREKEEVKKTDSARQPSRNA